MRLRAITFTLLVLASPIAVVADQPVKKLRVTVTQFGYHGGPNTTKNFRTLDKDSVAISADLDHIFPFRSPVYVSGQFLGFRDATLSPKFHRTIAAYNPDSVAWEGDRVGYVEVPVDRPEGKPAKETHDAFAPNSKLPADAVELSASGEPDKADYYQTLPKKRPWNVPDDYIPVRVYQGKKFIGWTYISKEDLAMLHKPKKT